MVSESDILDAVCAGQPFYIEYRFVGDNPQNKSGKSSKFWLIECGGGPSPLARPLIIETRFGPIGRWGQRGGRHTDFRDALKEAVKKEKKGYRIHQREVGDAALALMRRSSVQPTLPPFSQWARELPPPFNTIAFLDSNGFATDRTGTVVCQLPVDEAVAIRQAHDMTR